MELSSQILSDITIHMKYAKYLPKKKRRETWAELVDRNKLMHIKKHPQLKKQIEEVYKYVHDKKVLPSMRALQFSGKPIELNPSRLFNCSFMPMDHPDAFSEVMFLLLSGCGVGYSVQQHHVLHLPPVLRPIKERRYLVGDSIEGWSDAVKVLVESYFGKRAKPRFDFSDIRVKGERLITSGGKAPGPEPLKKCLQDISRVFDRKENGTSLTTLEVHDINCFIADAVLSGGIRRSAMISLFSFRDEEMLTCKMNAFWELNPQRSRANNSAVILRHKILEEDFKTFWLRIQANNTGEPGWLFTNDQEVGTNPCGEISLKANQFCNLTTINVSDVKTQAELNLRCRAAAFIGTLQASYTDFHYLRIVWKETTEKEALIGVSMTGIASGCVMDLNLKEAAEIVKLTNEEVAKEIGINKAARCTTVKPEGTSSLVLGCSSGVHAWHNDFYIRRLRLGKNESLYSYLNSKHSDLIEDEIMKPQSQAVISVPQKAPKNAVTRQETALQILSRVKKLNINWIKPGHRKGHNTNNVSCTVSIKPNEWERIGDWLWNNRNNYTAISVLPFDGGVYQQAPYEDIDAPTYKRMCKSLSDIDLTKIVEIEDNTDLKAEVACGNGGCDVVYV